MKFYAVQWSWDGADSEDPMTEWFTTKKEAIARAKEVAIDNEDGIYGSFINVYKSEVPTTKKALLKWLNHCSGVVSVPESNLIRKQEAMTSTNQSVQSVQWRWGVSDE